MKSKWFFTIPLLLASLRSPAQTTPPPDSTDQPSFEAASIRMVAPYTEPENLGGAGSHPWNDWPSNRFTAHRLTLKLLIGLSYNVDQKHIQGDPAWLDSQHYDIEAKVDGDAMLSYAQMKPLLQHLLEERFHLTVHRKTESASGYALVVANGGPKLKPGPDKPSTNGYILFDEIHFPSIGMTGFASILSSPIGNPIVDKTGLPGNYDIDVHYAPANDANSNLPSIFTALQEQLGLKLESQKVPVDFLIIDYVDRIPTGN
jgi:uncharacterized protein (TIGR03435 family)